MIAQALRLSKIIWNLIRLHIAQIVLHSAAEFIVFTAAALTIQESNSMQRAKVIHGQSMRKWSVALLASFILDGRQTLLTSGMITLCSVCHNENHPVFRQLNAFNVKQQQ